MAGGRARNSNDRETRGDRRRIESLAVALTEQRNPRSENLEKMSARQLVELFVDEEKSVQNALHNSIDDLVAAVEIVSDSLRQNGRLFYVGAGTSGRLGVLDASEIPPTFGASSSLVQGIIAGGARALSSSVEGAEDEKSDGALAIHRRGIKEGDVVVGISASGRTPFVVGALQRAKSAGAKTILLRVTRPTTSDVDLQPRISLLQSVRRF